MRHPWTVPVLLALTAFVGYAAASRQVQAQAEQWPFSTGEVITLTFAGGGTRPSPLGDKGHVCAVWHGPASALEHRPA
jgi:hypothetical protein